jgi:hypothetical protein
MESRLHAKFPSARTGADPAASWRCLRLMTRTTCCQGCKGRGITWPGTDIIGHAGCPDGLPVTQLCSLLQRSIRPGAGGLDPKFTYQNLCGSLLKYRRHAHPQTST